MKIPYQIRELADQFDDRPALEKILVALVLIAGLAWAYSAFVSGPLSSDVETLERQIVLARNELITLQQREQLAIETSRADPNEPVRVRIQRAIDAQSELDGDIQQLAGNLVTPQSMTRMLTSMLERQSGLTLISIENTQPEIVQSATDSPAGAGADQRSQNIYKHGLSIQLEGDYLTLISYLRRIESSPERFFWDELTFTQVEWPRATISIELHTLSTDEGFVGV